MKLIIYGFLQRFYHTHIIQSTTYIPFQEMFKNWTKSKNSTNHDSIENEIHKICWHSTMTIDIEIPGVSQKVNRTDKKMT